MDTLDIKKSIECKMKKSIEMFKNNISKIRTHRASTKIIENIKFKYQKSFLIIKNISNLSLIDYRTICIRPYDKTMNKNIEKAIIEKNIGLNPIINKDFIKLIMPYVTKERRIELSKILHNEGENFKIKIRNFRKQGNDNLRNLIKNKKISKDDHKRLQNDIQKITNYYIIYVNKLINLKEKEIMNI